jgi:hypothetical protein
MRKRFQHIEIRFKICVQKLVALQASRPKVIRSLAMISSGRYRFIDMSPSSSNSV